jgi:menaquinol-cytochrome c reductase iron-sulfur subunit
MTDATRRHFFGKAIAAIAGFIGLGLSIPLLGYAILPTLRKREEGWSEVGSIHSLEVNRPKEFEIVRSVKSGWMEGSSIHSVWAFRTPAGERIVYSPICPHLGCAFQWEEGNQRFFCPCHDSVFDLEGRVLAGPAPRPLDTLPMKLEGDRLFVLYKEFKAGIRRKEEI